MDYFRGKRITVMGLGLLGRGVGDVKFLAEEGAELTVTDIKTAEELQPSLEKLKDFKNITFVLGGRRLKDFKDRDFILKAAGVSLDSPFIAEARKNNIPVYMSTALFAKLTPATIVGITGTRGKSTVTYMIYDILRSAYRGTSKKIFLGGNIKGIATLPFLRKAKEGDIAVLELDSWQLQGFGDLGISPHVSIFTTFMPDHLNYYKGNMDAYLSDKANIFLHQTSRDTLVVGEQVIHLIKEKFGERIQSKIIVADRSTIPTTWNIKIAGEHNRYNASLASAAASALGVKKGIIKQALESFKGVPGRLEYLKTVRGVRVYNDTNATVPEATIAGIRALSKKDKRNIILIMGGSDKELDMNPLLEEIETSVKGVVLLPGSGSEKLRERFMDIAVVPKDFALTLPHAISLAFGMAEKGDTLLFSPAFASFGMFKNEYDRGEQFVELIKNL